MFKRVTEILRGNRRAFACAAALALAVAAVYWQVGSFGFIAIDDSLYVSNNPKVLQGISWDSVRWAFTTTAGANWHPLTWLSLMADAQIGRIAFAGFEKSPQAGVFHVTNAVLHVINTLLLFALLLRTTGSVWRSAFVAALFGLHPLHVESVAWVSERKDVLSGLFWMLALHLYVRYAVRPSARRYLAVTAVYALGLMTKPMLVSLPLVMLMMDYWPLGRTAAAGQTVRSPGAASLRRLALEKLPLFALSAAACAAALWAQGAAVVELELASPGIRLANAAVSAVSYIGKTISPANLAVFYPHPGPTIPVWQVAASVVLIVLGCVLALWCANRCRAVTVGWAWYLVTLVPVIGIVQVGSQAMADRYTYLPLIGFFIAAVWGAGDLVGWVERKLGRPVVGGQVKWAVALAILGGFAVSAAFQASYWRNTISLMAHAVEVTKDNYYAHAVLSAALHKAGRDDEALQHALAAIKAKPVFAGGHYRLGVILASRGNYRDAAAHYRIALRTDPDNPDIRNDLGIALANLGDYAGAEREFMKALAAAPDHASARKNLNMLPPR